MFDHGRIVERGSYDELVRAGGPFSVLVATQAAPDGEAGRDLSRKLVRSPAEGAPELPFASVVVGSEPISA